jgi:hypothetical protein
MPRTASPTSPDLQRRRQRTPSAGYTAFTILLDRMHRVQTDALFAPPSVLILTVCMLGKSTRFVLLFAWLTWFPMVFFLPQITQVAMNGLLSVVCTERDLYDTILAFV